MQTILLFNLIYLFYQDLKERQVYVWSALSLYGLTLITYHGHFMEISFLIDRVLNFIFLILLISIVAGISQLLLKIDFSKAIGTGDYLFFGFMALYFGSTEFLVLFISSLIVALLCSFLFRFKWNGIIPLAGIQAICVCAYLIVKLLNL